MQDRYAGDVGDFVKLGLLRTLSRGRKMGVAWYRFPDENHNDDGNHVSYLNHPDRFETLDPALFAHLRSVVRDARSIASLMPMLGEATSTDEALDVSVIPKSSRRQWRREWFSRVIRELKGCDVVFADPDNGIVDDLDARKGSAKFGKQIPLAEVKALAEDRCAVIYHHNTRRIGGHDAEIDYLFDEIGLPGLAVRATAHSSRTFFVLNPDQEIANRVRTFCDRWRIAKVRLHEPVRP